jgi:Phytoene dehydrogenase and related proteins
MEFLDSYFIDPELKLFFQTILYTFGQTARSASALTAAVVLKEFMLDGGYFPEKGVYDFVNKLVELFKDLGGEIRFSCPAQKIEIENNITKGILLQKNDFISATFVVSNIDATTTFFNLIGEKLFR